MTKTSLNSLHEQLPQAAIDDGDLPSGHESDKHTLYAQLGQCLTLSDCQTTAHRPTTDLAMEIRNAEELIQSTPGLPTGYIRAGELYSLLGYQQRAMSLYMDGLNNTNSEYHGVLQRQYEAAKTKDEKRIDILTVVPYDVVVDIVNYLATKEHLVLLNVSKAWRDILSGHSSIWRNIAISDSDTLSVAEISRVARFGSHTLDFTLSRMSMKFGEALLYQLSKGSFNSLVHLGLYSCEIPSGSVLIKALAQVAGTLEKLDIAIPLTEMQQQIPYKSILATCLNLKYFSYESDLILRDYTTGSLGPAYISKLTDFRLQTPLLMEESVKEILCCSPELRHLNIGRYCPISIMKTVLSHCKNLETFIFGNYGQESYDQEWLKRNRRMSNSVTGLRTFAANILDDPHDFIPLFASHCNTIEALMVGIVPFHPDQWMPLTNGFGNFSNLQFLDLLCDATQACNCAADLLRKSPSITRLRCSFESEDIGNDIIKEIVNAPNLKELEIAHTQGNEQAIGTLFQGFANKGSQLSRLQRLALMDLDFRFPIAAVLDHLPNIPTLKEFELATCPSATEPMVINFCSKMQLHPSIETIKLDYLTCITNTTLNALVAVKGLKYLKLGSLRNITEQGIQVFSGSIKLEIVDCPKVGRLCLYPKHFKFT